MRIKVIRILEIEGEEEWVNNTLDYSLVGEYKTFTTPSGTIREIYRVKVEEEKNGD